MLGGDRVVRREAWMGQHPDRVEARRRQKARMGAVKSGVVLPDRRHPQLLDLRFLHSLRLGATILKPDLHLGLGEVKGGREFGPLRDAQVLPFRELLLEREQLLRGERRPRLPVRLVFPQVALDLGRLPVLVQRRVMREMRGEEARGGGCGGCCRGRGCTLMPSAPNGGMEPGRNAGDPTQTGKSADVSRRRPHRRWAAPLLVVTTTTTMMMVMVLQVLHVDQTVLVLLLDVLGFRTPGPALVRAASRRLRAKLRMIVARERRHFGGRGTGYHFRRGPALRLHHVVQRSRARGLARPVNLLDFRKSGQRPRVHQGGSWSVARVLTARSVLLDGGRRGQVSRSVFGRWILLWRSGIRDRRQLIVSDGGVRGEGGRSRRDGGRVRLFSVRQQRSDGEAQSVHRFRDRLGRLGLVGTWAARWRRHRGGHP